MKAVVSAQVSATPDGGVGAAADAVDAAGAVAVLEAAAAGMAAAARVLEGDGAGSVGASVISRVVTGLGLVDAALTAARVRVVAAAEAIDVPGAEGFPTTGAWLADRLGLTGRGGAGEARLVADLIDQPDILAALDAGRISREHAVSIAAGLARADDAADAALAQARADEDERRRAQEAVDAAAQAQADATERARLARQAAAEEARRRSEAAERAAALQAEAAAEAAARAATLLAAAADGATPDQVRRQGRDLADTDAMREQREAAQWARRSVQTWRDETVNMGMLKWQMPMEIYETVLAGLSAATAPDPAQTPAHLRRTPAQRRADALADLLNLAMTHSDRPMRGGEVPNLTVRIPIAALLDQPALGDTQAGGIAAGGAVLAKETVRRLGCDAAIVRAITSPTGTILDAGRSTRIWSTSQRRVIETRDGGCRFGDCDRPVAFCQIHHVTWWRHGGRTSTTNGVLLCAWHHRAVHHDGWTLDFDPVDNIVTATRDTTNGTRDTTNGTQTLTSYGATTDADHRPTRHPSTRPADPAPMRLAV